MVSGPRCLQRTSCPRAPAHTHVGGGAVVKDMGIERGGVLLREGTWLPRLLWCVSHGWVEAIYIMMKAGWMCLALLPHCPVI